MRYSAKRLRAMAWVIIDGLFYLSIVSAANNVIVTAMHYGDVHQAGVTAKKASPL